MIVEGRGDEDVDDVEYERSERDACGEESCMAVVTAGSKHQLIYLIERVMFGNVFIYCAM